MNTFSYRRTMQKEVGISEDQICESFACKEGYSKGNKEVAF
jgi:hypothetical protein